MLPNLIICFFSSSFFTSCVNRDGSHPFWMVNLKLVKAEQPENAVEPAAAVVEKAEPAAITPDEIMQEAAKAAQDTDVFISGETVQSQSADEPNQVIEIKAEESAPRKSIKHWFQPKQKHFLY